MRSYVRIKEETDEELHLVKETGLYGYTLLVGKIMSKRPLCMANQDMVVMYFVKVCRYL